jgi:hypothetical protein
VRGFRASHRQSVNYYLGNNSEGLGCSDELRLSVLSGLKCFGAEKKSSKIVL